MTVLLVVGVIAYCERERIRRALQAWLFDGD